MPTLNPMFERFDESSPITIMSGSIAARMLHPAQPLLDSVIESVAPEDCWIADRNFCTAGFLHGIAERGASFIIRRHRKLSYRPVGQMTRVGQSETLIHVGGNAYWNAYWGSGQPQAIVERQLIKNAYHSY
jgi:hypothetical protein